MHDSSLNSHHTFALTRSRPLPPSPQATLSQCHSCLVVEALGALKRSRQTASWQRHTRNLAYVASTAHGTQRTTCQSFDRTQCLCKSLASRWVGTHLSYVLQITRVTRALLVGAQRALGIGYRQLCCLEMRKAPQNST